MRVIFTHAREIPGWPERGKCGIVSSGSLFQEQGEKFKKLGGVAVILQLNIEEFAIAQ